MSDPAQQPSVAITSLSIRDFRGIDRLELDFRGPDGHPNSLVVLAGPNGCGKTAVLEAALMLAGGVELITGLRPASDPSRCEGLRASCRVPGRGQDVA